jgi:hypothetical protein
MYVFWEIFPQINCNSPTSNDIIYKISIPTTKIENAITWQNQLREVKTPQTSPHNLVSAVKAQIGDTLWLPPEQSPGENDTNHHAAPDGKRP